jgi:hypothetical protein
MKNYKIKCDKTRVFIGLVGLRLRLVAGAHAPFAVGGQGAVALRFVERLFWSNTNYSTARATQRDAVRRTFPWYTLERQLIMANGAVPNTAPKHLMFYFIQGSFGCTMIGTMLRG